MPTIPAKLGFVRFSRGQPVTESNPSKVFAAIALMIGTGSGSIVNKKNRCGRCRIMHLVRHRSRIFGHAFLAMRFDNDPMRVWT